MSDHEHVALVNLVKVVTSESLTDLKHEMREHFAALKRDIDERDKRLLEDLLIRIKPVVGDFKDKAVAEAQQNMVQIIERLFNVNPADNEQVSKFQQIIAFSHKKMKDADRSALTIRDIFWSKTSTMLWILFAIGAGAMLKDLAKFIKEYGAFFLGGS